MDNKDESKPGRNLDMALPDSIKYSFHELFDIDQVQMIQDSFSKATGVASIITEIDGTPITKPSSFSFFCNEVIRKTEKGLLNCMMSDAIIGSPNPHGPRMERCLSGGLLDGGTSIMVGDHHVANWLIGQVLDEEADLNNMNTYCSEIGADPVVFRDALHKVYTMPKERFADICQFLYLNAKMISSLAVKNLDQQEEIKKRKEAEEKYRFLTEFASDVIWVLNVRERRYTYVSPSVFQLRGFTPEEAMGERLEDSVTPLSLVQVNAQIKKGIEDLQKQPDSHSYVIEVQQPCKNGTFIWVEVSTKFRYNAKGDIEVVGVSRNIEERKIAEAKVIYLSYRDQLTGLANRRFYEDELIRIDHPANMPLTLIMLDVNGLKLTNDAFGHQAGDVLLLKVATILSALCPEKCTAARIGGDEFVLILPNCSTADAENMMSRINRAIASEKAENIILSVSMGFAVKISAAEDMNQIFRKAEDNMYKSKLYDSSSMRSKTIDLIMNTLYEKNHREMLHSKRVSEICEAIAEKMHFDKDDINQIRLAGLMHDIGKIGIDEQILNKNNKLNNQEWNEIHRHSEVGYRILSSVNEFSEIAGHVLAHHERWDGKGYPKGLQGEEIPLESRIIAIADAYDAMTSDRTYRKKLTTGEAVKELIKYANLQFDADIARIFVEKVLGFDWD